MTVQKRKLIEVALPLEAINRESAREKTIRAGHPSTLHLWWARRPLAACRAVLFAQLVDDPSSDPDRFPTPAAQSLERSRLFGIIERLVDWDNIGDIGLLSEAHAAIVDSCGGEPPTILDPFAGGGSIPLEAQRLGLRAEASDLNPVATLINRALIALPPLWVDQPPVFPDGAGSKLTWPAVTGLAEDVRAYGETLQELAEIRVGGNYPRAQLADGTMATALAWVWARTVQCSNPACAVDMPLVRSWWLGKKKGKEAFVVARAVEDAAGGRHIEYSIGSDPKRAPTGDEDGTVTRNGAVCVACRTAVPLSYVRAEGQAGRIGHQMMAIVAEGDRRRHYLPVTSEQLQAAAVPPPSQLPETELPEAALGFRVQGYGMRKYSELFTSRQLNALAAFSELIGIVRERVLIDAAAAGLAEDGVPLNEGGRGATAYADTIATYLALALGRQADYLSSLCLWGSNTKNEGVMHVFGRQTLSMVWDYAEANPFSDSSGNFGFMVRSIERVLKRLSPPSGEPGLVAQMDAQRRDYSGVLVSTDPPYYDNVPYADLSDFFYSWLRTPLRDIHPDLFGTVQTPKADELVADPFRHGGKDQASQFFEAGFNGVFSRIRQSASNDFPITVFYAFKQSESDDEGSASTGWQTLLDGMMRTGWEITATWPIRTEMATRMRGRNSNALASSIVLALRPRPSSAESINRRTFIGLLKSELPAALRALQQGSVAPVDLAQAAIGPGMAVFSRHSRVIEADGSDMTVRTALALINQVLDAVLAEQEGDFDAETRFCVKWFAQFGWNEGEAGVADVLSRAVNTSVTGLVRGGVFRATAGKAGLVEPKDMSSNWSPADDVSICIWEVSVRVAQALRDDGAERAAQWLVESATRVDLDAVKELSYLLYSICEKKGWADAAMLFNGLGTSWSDLQASARAPKAATSTQGVFDLNSDDDE